MRENSLISWSQYYLQSAVAETKGLCCFFDPIRFFRRLGLNYNVVIRPSVHVTDQDFPSLVVIIYYL